MTMNFWRAGSIGCFGVFLFAAGCTVETGSEDQEADVASTTQAVCGDYNSFVAACQSMCIGTCTNGSMIAGCMSSCMAGYCAGPPATQP